MVALAVMERFKERLEVPRFGMKDNIECFSRGCRLVVIILYREIGRHSSTAKDKEDKMVSLVMKGQSQMGKKWKRRGTIV